VEELNNIKEKKREFQEKSGSYNEYRDREKPFKR
jgi:hypothetical protein